MHPEFMSLVSRPRFAEISSWRIHNFMRHCAILRNDVASSRFQVNREELTGQFQDLGYGSFGNLLNANEHVRNMEFEVRILVLGDLMHFDIAWPPNGCRNQKLHCPIDCPHCLANRMKCSFPCFGSSGPPPVLHRKSLSDSRTSDHSSV